MNRAKLIGLGVSTAILAILYWQIDIGALWQALGRTDLVLLLGACAIFVPATLLSAGRLSALTPAGARLPLGESLRLVLMASVLNTVLPSKLGDIAKAYAITERGHLPAGAALSLVVFEKAWDLLALIGFCALGLLLLPAKGVLFWLLAAAVAGAGLAGVALVGSRRFADLVLGTLGRRLPGGLGRKLAGLAGDWAATLDRFWADRTRAFGLIGLSLLIWLLHLVQIWLFIEALGATVPFLVNLGLTPLAIFVGLMPFTFAGVGTRDAALVLLYAPFMDAATAAALGLLCTLRYLIPALAGLPLLGSYLGEVRALRNRAS